MTIEPAAPRAFRLCAQASAATRLVPVEPPTRRPRRTLKRVHRAQAPDVGHLDHRVQHAGHERGLDARPADAFDARAAVQRQPRVAADVVVEEHRMLGIDAAHPRVVAAVVHVAADGGQRAAGAGAGDDPGRAGMRLAPHLQVDALGDVVVGAPVGGPFGVGELVHVVAASARRPGARSRRTASSGRRPGGSGRPGTRSRRSSAARCRAASRRRRAGPAAARSRPR